MLRKLRVEARPAGAPRVNGARRPANGLARLDRLAPPPARRTTELSAHPQAPRCSGVGSRRPSQRAVNLPGEGMRPELLHSGHK